MKNKSDVEEEFTASTIFRGLKNASYLATGHFLSMLISFIGFVYIARLLGPSDYGIYATVGAFVGMFDVITVYGINKVVLREGSKKISQMHDYLERTTGIKNFFTFIAIAVCIFSSIFMVNIMISGMAVSSLRQWLAVALFFPEFVLQPLEDFRQTLL